MAFIAVCFVCALHTLFSIHSLYLYFTCNLHRSALLSSLHPIEAEALPFPAATSALLTALRQSFLPLLDQQFTGPDPPHLSHQLCSVIFFLSSLTFFLIPRVLWPVVSFCSFPALLFVCPSKEGDEKDQSVPNAHIYTGHILGTKKAQAYDPAIKEAPRNGEEARPREAVGRGRENHSQPIRHGAAHDKGGRTTPFLPPDLS